MFQNILVGVDLSQCQPLKMSNLNSQAQETIQQSIWLAQRCGARLHFFSVFTVSEETLHGLDLDNRSQVMLTLEEKALPILDELVQRAADHQVAASRGFALGKAWFEIIRETLRGQYDLAIVGTRELTGFRRMLLGNTALKLLRRCPCPVWVVKPGLTLSSLNILAAVDLKPASGKILALSVALAKLLGATLHILHVVDYPLDRLAWVDLESATTDDYHHKVREQAAEVLRCQLEQTEYRDLGDRCRIHLQDGIGAADLTIQEYIHTHRVDLLIMGTIGRSGLGGILIGNTAERLLPEIHCSVLAVKPPEFQCPVSLK